MCGVFWDWTVIYSSSAAILLWVLRLHISHKRMLLEYTQVLLTSIHFIPNYNKSSFALMRTSFNATSAKFCRFFVWHQKHIPTTFYTTINLHFCNFQQYPWQVFNQNNQIKLLNTILLFRVTHFEPFLFVTRCIYTNSNVFIF